MDRTIASWLLAWAIFYNSQDLAVIAAAVNAARTDARMTTAQRTAAGRVWNNGMSAWATAPLAATDRREGDGDTRVVVVNVAQVTRTQACDLFAQIATRMPEHAYLRKIAEDARRSSGGQEPWP